MAAGHVDAQVGQRQPVHADAAGEGLELVCIVHGFPAVPAGLLLQLVDDFKELCVLVDGCPAANFLCLLLQILDFVNVSYPLRTLGLTHHGLHLDRHVALGALGGRLGHFRGARF